MLVISENVLWRSVVQDRQRAPAPADIGEILQQGGLSGMTAEATQPPRVLIADDNPQGVELDEPLCTNLHSAEVRAELSLPVVSAAWYGTSSWVRTGERIHRPPSEPI